MKNEPRNSSTRRGEAGRGAFGARPSDKCPLPLGANERQAPPTGEGRRLVAVNSINWARIVAQIPYYFYAALQFDRPVSFSVPTGNFGDIYAGYIAKKMGLPIDQLIVATNSNNLLERCFKSGDYAMDDVVHTYSPSMDIQISSNFERLLFDVHNHDGKAVASLMDDLRRDKKFTLSSEARAALQADFSSASANDEETLQTIAGIYKAHDYLLDPHTAVGLAAGRKCRKGDAPLIVLATAHPAKFPDAVEKATGVHPALPGHLADLMTRKEKFISLPNNVNEVKKFIEGIV